MINHFALQVFQVKTLKPYYAFLGLKLHRNMWESFIPCNEPAMSLGRGGQLVAKEGEALYNRPSQRAMK